jgi:hypothetical protein
MIHNFMRYFVATKNGQTNKIFPSSFGAVVGYGRDPGSEIRDPGSEMDKNQDPG